MAEVPNLTQGGSVARTTDVRNVARLRLKSIRDLAQGVSSFVRRNNSVSSQHVKSGELMERSTER
jgi:hypothetical protein